MYRIREGLTKKSKTSGNRYAEFVTVKTHPPSVIPAGLTACDEMGRHAPARVLDLHASPSISGWYRLLLYLGSL